MKRRPRNVERKNLAAQIGSQIAEELMTGDLKPGQALVLRKMAEEFGVSQTPVREALLQLVTEGALEMSPSRSIRVPKPSIEQLRELRELRVLIECYTAGIATANISREAIEELEKIHASMMSARANNRVRDVLILNKDFHLLLYEQAGQVTTVSIIKQLWMRMAPYLNYIYEPELPSPNLTRHGHPHEKVLEGLKRKDPDEVRAGLEWDLRYLQEHVDNNILLVIRNKAMD